MTQEKSLPQQEQGGDSLFLFTACFVALVATSFAFIIRVMCMDQWQIDFGLSETQKGEIFGAGMWPFGISIVLFSLIVDSVGYGRSMGFAFLCHISSALILLTAKGYWGLYVGSILNGLAAGTVEAVINPVVATVYSKTKTKMLSFLHAGWPGGMVIGGILMLVMHSVSKDVTWKVYVAVILIPTLVYGLMTLKCKFPVQERVAAGIPYRDMLSEAGTIVAFLVTYIIVKQLGLVFGLPSALVWVVVIAATAAYFAYTKSLGQPVYIILVGIMVLLAITELGIDSWVSDLMSAEMAKMNLPGQTLLIYTAMIAMVLRFCIGPIEKALKPLGVLFVGSVLAAIGLFALSKSAGMVILVTATLYAFGTAFFWPVTLGLVSERFPKGGALTMNAISGVGMLGVGILGSAFLGNIQDTNIDKALQPDANLYTKLIDQKEKTSIFGNYKSLDGAKVNDLEDKIRLYTLKDDVTIRNAYDHLVRAAGDTSAKTVEEMRKGLEDKGAFVDEATYKVLVDEKTKLDGVRIAAKKRAMATIAALPAIMAVCYLGLILYFKSQGGYKAIELSAGGGKKE